MPAAEGMMLGAMGNHYTGSAIKVCLFMLYLLLTRLQRNVITDETKVRLVVVIGPPTQGGERLISLYNSQIMCPNDVFVSDEQREPVCMPF